MFPKIRWRIASTYIFLILVIMGIFAFLMLRPNCIQSPYCVRQRYLQVTLVLLFGSFVTGLVLAHRTAQPLSQLTRTIQRIIAGDHRSHILSQARDETGDLIRAFNQMVDVLSSRLTTLEKERRQLAIGMEYLADGVLIADERGYVRRINPAACRLLKIKEKKALGLSIAEVVRHHQLIELWQRCQDEDEEQIEAVEVGRELFLQAIVTPFQEAESQGYLVILQDLTTIRQLQTIRRDFISNISHELRTPLASVRAIVETLQDGALADPPAAERFLYRAEREVDTLTQMVEELLELSRIDSGQVPLRLAPTAVSDLILVSLERYRPMARRNQIDLIVDLPAHLPPVLADHDRVQRVLSNLVHNAIKFTPPGGSVTISAQQDKDATTNGGDITFSVKDTGIGITKTDLPRVFERFYKSDRARTRARGGTGLGLAIARPIVQAHNGRIWVKSKEGKGSTFYFNLPVANDESP